MLWIEDIKRLLIVVDFEESSSAFNNAVAISSDAVEFVLAHRRLEKRSAEVERALAIAGVFVEIRVLVTLVVILRGKTSASLLEICSSFLIQ